jgi:hypothetical protein
MTTDLDDQRTTDEEYIQRVLKHKPSSLVPWIARVGAQYKDIGSWLEGDYMRFTPWALADIARVSLVLGGEFRHDATRSDLLLCADAYRNLADPELGSSNPGSIEGFLLRMAHEQLPFQQSLKGEIVRNVALFEQTTLFRDLKVIQQGWDQDLLGCSLSQFAGIGFVVYAVAKQHNGRFSTHWFGDPVLQPITSEIPVALMRDVLDRQFVGDRDYFRGKADENEPSPYRRFTFNPLLARPVVRMASELLVPVPLQVIRKISPLGVWYAGVERWGESFAEDVGDLFQAYVGRLLQTIPDAAVYPEISYDPDGDKRSVDWIVVWNDVVLLVEVKSARSTQSIRMGNAKGWTELSAKLGHAYTQIAKSSQLIADAHPKFSHIPRNLPRIGLILTMEPFPFMDAGLIRSMIGASPIIPMRVCSCNQLEWLVCLRDRSVGEYLVELMNNTDKEGWEVGSDLVGMEFAPNTVLDQAWSSFRWSPTVSGEGSPPA